MVAKMTTIASLQYVSPAWWGYTSAAERSRLERLVANLRGGGYLPVAHPSFEDLAMTSDQRLYRSIIHNRRTISCAGSSWKRAQQVIISAQGHTVLSCPLRTTATLSHEFYLTNC